MKYVLLSLPLIASATLAAARETPLDPSRLWAKSQLAPAASSAGEPPWLTGTLDERLITESAAADPHANIGDPHEHQHDDPHAAYQGADDAQAQFHDDHADDPHGSLLDVPDVAPLARSAASNARSVVEIVAQRGALSDRVVSVRATVVKLTEGILGKTYLHLRDGSGSAAGGDHDLTATTTEPFELGETIEVEGRVTIDQDIGLGYRYPVLLAETRRVTR
ncbi:MAG: hypothetical protein ABW217_03345 [Polyangiaceae bacterium]